MTKYILERQKAWLAAHLELLEAEKEHPRGDELAQRRQQLPWVQLDKPTGLRPTKGAPRWPTASGACTSGSTVRPMERNEEAGGATTIHIGRSLCQDIKGAESMRRRIGSTVSARPLMRDRDAQRGSHT